MPAERRGQVIAVEIGSTGNGRSLTLNGRRQPSCGGTSRMTRECQVRICERLGVKFPGPTRHLRPTRSKPTLRPESGLHKSRCEPPLRPCVDGFELARLAISLFADTA